LKGVSKEVKTVKEWLRMVKLVKGVSKNGKTIEGSEARE